MTPISVLIAEDHPVFRDGMHALLDSAPDIQVVGEAATGKQAVYLARSLQPQVILMDIGMPDLNGIEATRQIIHDNAAINILILTMHEDDDSVFAAMRAGARGYLLKGAAGVDILRALQTVSGGEAIFSATIATRLMHYFAGLKPSGEPLPELTPREYEILDLLAHGQSNQEIADELVLGHKTVRNHLSNIYNKLQVADRTQAVIRARNAGMGQS
jgi:DNA-binding NarL/FixJ family response regulator